MPQEGEQSSKTSTPGSLSPSSPSLSSPPPPHSSPSHLLLASPWGALGRSLALTVVAAACKAVLFAGNTFEVRYGGEEGDGSESSESSSAAARGRFLSLAAARPAGRGLLSVCNHTSTLDDPALFAALLPLSLFMTDPLGGRGQERDSSGSSGSGGGKAEEEEGEASAAVGGGRSVRWSLCASDICFNKGKILSDFFLSGKTLPVERGKGVSQPSTETAAEALRGGGWVHVFPDGRVEPSGRLPPPPPPPPRRAAARPLSRAWGRATSFFPFSPSSAGEEARKAEEEGKKEETTTEPRTAPPPSSPSSSAAATEPAPPLPGTRRPPRAFRRGVGALFCDCLNRGGQPPVLLPFYHSGMSDVMPRGGRLPRLWGKEVTVVVGEEVDVSDLSPGCSSPDERVRRETWAAIAERLRRELVKLEEKAPRNRDQRSEREKEADRENEAKSRSSCGGNGDSGSF